MKEGQIGNIADLQSQVFLSKPYKETQATTFWYYVKVRQSQNDLLKLTFLPKKQTNEFNFTTMIPQVDMFSFVFLKKLKTPKIHFEIN